MSSQDNTAARPPWGGATTGGGPLAPDPLHPPPDDQVDDAADPAQDPNTEADLASQADEESAGPKTGTLQSLSRKQSEVPPVPMPSDDEPVEEPFLWPFLLLTWNPNVLKMRCFDFLHWMEEEADQHTGQAHDILPGDVLGNNAAGPLL